ncbi:MAG: DNA starvation/stationary phase protection protein [Chitinophagales bacterium]|nr:DNA starvation/stationary phase protection protein [Chitinophagales bacterium]MCZ2392599.1 DNA starvation/stationary phase protection protein [Chitinophagales bacterium]
MAKLSKIGLDKTLSEKLATQLNVLLSDYQIFYQNLRGLHWNIKGNQFFELHAKFEELYNDAQIKIDEIAERILTLGFTPLHTFEDYINHAEVRVGKNISNAEESVSLVLESLKVIVVVERELLTIADDLGDEGTLTLLTDFITEQEKTIWMYSSWLNK